MNSVVKPIEETTPESLYYAQFELTKNGECTFTLMDQDGKAVPDNAIIVDTATEKIDLVLETVKATEAVWAKYFQWIDPNTGTSCSTPPGNITFTWVKTLLVTLFDQNTTTKSTPEEFRFRMVVNYNGVIYESKDPVIINKKPPE